MSGFVVLILRILMIVSLYGFLGVAIYAIWKELQINSQIISKSKIPKLTIEVVDEEIRKSQDFNTPEVIIGRDPHSDFPIPRETVSSHHARLSFHQKNWWVEDLQSTNGTLINGDLVLTATVLVDGDEIRCGDVNIQVQIHELK